MIQIDMPMPENCASCCFALAKFVEDFITLFCMTPIGRKMYTPDLINRNSRPERCPLKEQNAKVLTVDQLEDALDTVVWLETPVSENLADGYSLIMAFSHKYGYMYFDSPFGDNPSQDRLEYSEYGRSWRCWDKRPTDEQRQEVEWE